MTQEDRIGISKVSSRLHVAQSSGRKKYKKISTTSEGIFVKKAEEEEIVKFNSLLNPVLKSDIYNKQIADLRKDKVLKKFFKISYKLEFSTKRFVIKDNKIVKIEKDEEEIKRIKKIIENHIKINYPKILNI